MKKRIAYTISNFFKLGCAVALTASCTSQAWASPMSFGEAWQRVKTESEAIRASQANVDQARHERESKKDMYLPQINLTGSYLYLDDAVELGATEVLDSMPAGSAIGQMLAALAAENGMSPAQFAAGTTSTISEREVKSGNLTMLWPLFTGGRITAAQDIAKASLKEAELEMELKVRDRFEELAKRYFGVVMASQVVTTRREVEASLKVHLDHAELLVQNGQIAEVERLQAEASYDKAKIERIKSEEDLRIAQAALDNLLNSKDAQPITGLSIYQQIPTLAESTELALSTFPGLAVYDTKKQMATSLADIEKGKYFPEVAALGNYNLYEEDSLASELMPDWFVGVNISIPLIDRSGRHEKYQAAKSLQRRIESLRKQTRQDISLLVEKTYREIIQAQAEYDGLGTSLQLAEKTVELRTKAFQQGLATSLDVIDASLYVASVKTQRSHAAYNSVTKLARLLALRGNTDEITFDHLLMKGE